MKTGKKKFKCVILGVISFSFFIEMGIIRNITGILRVLIPLSEEFFLFSAF